MAEVGRHLWRPSSPTSCSEQDQLGKVAQSCDHSSFEYTRRLRFQILNIYFLNIFENEKYLISENGFGRSEIKFTCSFSWEKRTEGKTYTLCMKSTIKTLYSLLLRQHKHNLLALKLICAELTRLNNVILILNIRRIIFPISQPGYIRNLAVKWLHREPGTCKDTTTCDHIWKEKNAVIRAKLQISLI